MLLELFGNKASIAMQQRESSSNWVLRNLIKKQKQVPKHNSFKSLKAPRTQTHKYYCIFLSLLKLSS